MTVTWRIKLAPPALPTRQLCLVRHQTEQAQHVRRLSCLALSGTDAGLPRLHAAKCLYTQLSNDAKHTSWRDG